METAPKFNLDQRRAAIRKFRKQLNMTQGQLAKLADISPSMLSLFERGLRDLSLPAFERVEDAITDALAERRAEIQAEGARAVPLSLLRGELPEERFDRELTALKRSARELLTTHSNLEKTLDQLWKLYQQDEAQLTDYQKEIRLQTIEILDTNRRELLDKAENLVSTLEAVSGAAPATPLSPEAEDEMVSVPTVEKVTTKE